jgi:glycosyltransferase involved in cell wall biosynthesis
MSFSIIIPARNEENYLIKTLNSIPPDIETIVVCNACTDKTHDIAKANATVAINTPEPGVSKARNLGAKYASQPILVFLDADTKLAQDTLIKIERALKKSVVGTCKFKPDINNLRATTFSHLKNALTHLGSANGIIFCPKYVFNQIGGFNEKLTKRENHNFIKRARKMGKFRVINSKVKISMRRFEKRGYLKMILFWIIEDLFPSKKEYPVIR